MPQVTCNATLFHTTKARHMLLVGFTCMDPQESANPQTQSNTEQDKDKRGPQQDVPLQRQQSAQLQRPRQETRDPQQDNEHPQSHTPQTVKDGSVGEDKGGEGRDTATGAGAHARGQSGAEGGTRGAQEGDCDAKNDCDDADAEAHLRLLLQHAGFGEHGREWGDDTRRKAAKAEDVYKVVEQAGSAGIRMADIKEGVKGGKCADDEGEYRRWYYCSSMCSRSHVWSLMCSRSHVWSLLQSYATVTKICACYNHMRLLQ